jgi:hypothetical protein
MLTERATPIPVFNAALNSLRTLGISVEPLAAVAKNRPAVSSRSRVSGTHRPQAASDKSWRLYRYAMVAAANDKTGPPLLLAPTHKHFTAQGTFPPELVKYLKNLRRPLVLNLAGTKVSDQGLKQLPDFHRVVGLNLELCSRVTDAGLVHLQPLQHLKVLILTGTSVTYAGLRHLVPNPSLTALDLEVCDGIQDAACEALGKMRQLKALVLQKTGFEPHRISDAGLQHPKHLSNLEILNLYGNKVTDAGLISLRRLNKLQALDLSLLAITDSGLAHLKSLSNLQQLDLLYSEGFAGPTITDRGLKSLEPLTNLTTLNLTGARLTDAGLERLKVLKRLTSLQLVHTAVTADGIRKFQAAIPGCRIIPGADSTGRCARLPTARGWRRSSP